MKSEEELKVRICSIRFTKDEYDYISRKAESKKITVTDYIKLALGKMVKEDKK